MIIREMLCDRCMTMIDAKLSESALDEARAVAIDFEFYDSLLCDRCRKKWDDFRFDSDFRL